MAPLAPIPEGSRSQPVSRFSKLNRLDTNYSHKPRPQSRVFAASRRHVRTRYQRLDRPVETPLLLKENKPPLAEFSTKSTFENIHTTPEKTSEEQAEPSDSSFDLDSFPIPPSTSSSSSRHGAKSHPSSDLSSHEEKSNTRQKSARQLGLQIDGVNDYSSSSHRVSVDSALVDAITRNIVQQLRLSSAGRCKRYEEPRQAPADRSH